MPRNTTIATRLALGFGMTVAIGVAIVGYAAYTLHGLKDSVDELAASRMLKVAQFSQVRDNFQGVARFTRNIVINTEPQFVETEKKKIANARASNDALLAQLDGSITLPAGKALLETINKGRVAYNAAMDKAVEMALQGNTAAASALLVNEVRALQDVVFKATDDSIKMQQELAQALANHSSATATSGIAWMAGLAALMAAIGLVVGWLLTRALRTALGAEPAALNDAVARVAAGDLSQALSVPAGDATSVLANLARMQANLARVVAEVRSNSESVATASTQIAQGNEDLSQRTEEQASALQQTAATMEELNTTVRHNADSARQASQLAQDASAVAAQGGDVVGQVVGTMQGISDSSRKIGDIIGVIDSIAFQTNILALNAAVEAARAGEQGRGFAVVAGEVRTLAQRSAEAAKDIKALIGRSVEQVEQGASLVDQAGRTMGAIVDSIQRVNSIVAEIASASTEQSAGITQVGNAVAQMDQVTQQNAALVEESAAAAGSLKGQAQQLVQAVAAFKLPPGAASASAGAQRPVAARAGAGAGAGAGAAAAPAIPRSVAPRKAREPMAAAGAVTRAATGAAPGAAAGAAAPAAAPAAPAAAAALSATSRPAAPPPAQPSKAAMASAADSDDWAEF